MNNSKQQKRIAQLVQKLSGYSGLSVDVINGRLQERELDPEAAITLLSDQIFCYESDNIEFAFEIQELRKPSAKRRHAKSAAYA